MTKQGNFAWCVFSTLLALFVDKLLKDNKSNQLASSRMSIFQRKIQFFELTEQKIKIVDNLCIKYDIIQLIVKEQRVFTGD